MVRHVDAARHVAAIRREMNIGQQRPGIRISAFGGSEEPGTESKGRAARQGTDEELTARNSWQMNRHQSFLRVPGLSLKPKLQIGKSEARPSVGAQLHTQKPRPIETRILEQVDRKSTR